MRTESTASWLDTVTRRRLLVYLAGTLLLVGLAVYDAVGSKYGALEIFAVVTGSLLVCLIAIRVAEWAIRRWL